MSVSPSQSIFQTDPVFECEQKAEKLNKQCHCVSLDREAMKTELSKWQDHDNLSKVALDERQYLFSESAVFIAETHVRRQSEIIAAVEKVVALPAYQKRVLAYAPPSANYSPKAHGAFLAYDFHLSPKGPQLIEINTNAGGGLINAILAHAQKDCCDLVGGRRPGQLPGKLTGTLSDLKLPEQVFFEMFLEEWQAERGQESLRSVAIVDDNPEAQYMLPEFYLFKKLFEKNNIKAVICDPSQLVNRDDGVWHGELRIDLIYNRLTDFGFEAPAHKHICEAYFSNAVVITPHPRAHAIYADKRNLSILTDEVLLKELGVDINTRNTLLQGIAHTSCVHEKEAEALWANRKNLFFKPAKGYGSKAAYRGDKMTRRVFGELVHHDYVAQALVKPSERELEVKNEVVELKLDIRVYVYKGRTQFICARLYEGQTTNFRTPGGGFAQVLVIPCEDDEIHR